MAVFHAERKTKTRSERIPTATFRQARTIRRSEMSSPPLLTDLDTPWFPMTSNRRIPICPRSVPRNWKTTFLTQTCSSEMALEHVSEEWHPWKRQMLADITLMQRITSFSSQTLLAMVLIFLLSTSREDVNTAWEHTPSYGTGA